MRGRVLTYPNQLTILRILFIPCFVLLATHGHARGATAVFVLAGITDGLDGLLARRLHQKTPLGSFLDPVADKLLVTAAFVTLTVRSVPVALHIPFWLTVTSIVRDLLISLAVLALYLGPGHRSYPPSLLGKWTTAAQLLTVGVALLGNFIALSSALFLAVVYATWLLVVASGLHYLARTLDLVRSHRKVGAAP